MDSDTENTGPEPSMLSLFPAGTGLQHPGKCQGGGCQPQVSAAASQALVRLAGWDERGAEGSSRTSTGLGQPLPAKSRHGIICLPGAASWVWVTRTVCCVHPLYTVAALWLSFWCNPLGCSQALRENFARSGGFTHSRACWVDWEKHTQSTLGKKTCY